MFICTCGKEFKSQQALNGHRGRCASYLGDAKYEEINAKTSRTRLQKSQIVKNEELLKWKASNPHCEFCGKPLLEYYASGRFCNRSCANGWVSLSQSDEAKARKIEVGTGNLSREGRTSESWTLEQREHHSKVMTEVMSQPAVRYKISKALRGRSLSEETRLKISKINKIRYQEGRIKGWPSRNKENYAESFWRSVLENNNINFKQEFIINKRKDLSIEEGGCYFLDFYLIDKNIDLEIDGSSHYIEERKIKDQERDTRLTAKGIYVYRIKWVNPARNPLQVRDDIEQFLKFYESC